MYIQYVVPLFDICANSSHKSLQDRSIRHFLMSSPSDAVVLYVTSMQVHSTPQPVTHRMTVLEHSVSHVTHHQNLYETPPFRPCHHASDCCLQCEIGGLDITKWLYCCVMQHTTLNMHIRTYAHTYVYAGTDTCDNCYHNNSLTTTKTHTLWYCTHVHTYVRTCIRTFCLDCLHRSSSISSVKMAAWTCFGGPTPSAIAPFSESISDRTRSKSLV